MLLVEKTPSYMAYKRGADMNIIKNRRTYLIISLAVLLVGLVMFFINGFNYGIDFSGGTLVQINAKIPTIYG